MWQFRRFCIGPSPMQNAVHVDTLCFPQTIPIVILHALDCLCASSVFCVSAFPGTPVHLSGFMWKGNISFPLCSCKLSILLLPRYPSPCEGCFLLVFSVPPAYKISTPVLHYTLAILQVLYFELSKILIFVLPCTMSL